MARDSVPATADGHGTSRHQPGEQIREPEQQYRSIFEAAGEGMVIVSRDGVVVEANPAACQVFGYTDDELVGLPAGTILRPPDLFEAPTGADRAGGSCLRQGTGVRKDGTLFHVEGRVSSLVFAGEPRVLVIVRDVSQQVQAEKELRGMEEQYRSVFEAAGDGLVIHDAKGTIIEINPAYCRMLGYTRDELIGKHVNILIPPEHHHLIAEGMQAIAAGDTPQARVVVLRKDGTRLQVEGHGAAFKLDGKLHYLGVTRDISSRVQAEEQLREREEQYRSIFEATTDGLAILDTEGCFVEVNPAYCTLTGYSRDELIGMNTATLIHPDYRHLIAAGMQSISEGADVWNDSVLIRKDGSLVHIEGGGTSFTYRGKPHFLGMARDITERIRAAEQLREKEAQYRSIFEATTDGLGILDMEGNIVEVNPAYCRMYGYDRDEVIGLHALALMSPDYHHLLADGMRSIVEGNQVRVRSAGLRIDGTSFPVDGHGTTFLYNGKPHILGVSRDITEQVQAEKELREREAEYGAVFEATTDGLVINDLETGVIVEANPAFCRMHGYTHDEMVGMHPSTHIHPDYHHLFARYVGTAKDGNSFQTQAVDVRKDGTLFPVEVHGSAFTYRSKRHVLGVVRDITARVQADEQLREREEQYRSIFESSVDGLGIYDQKGFLVEANPALYRMLGYSRDELAGLHAGATVHPDYHHVIGEGLARVERDEPFRREIALLRRDGTAFPAEVSAMTFAYRGTPHDLVVLRDISERVEAEKQIHEREAEYRGIFEATNDGLIIADADGYIVEANPAYCRMFGYTRNEVIGLHSSALAAPEWRHTIAESVEALASADTYQAVAKALRKDGSAFFAEARATRFMYRGQVHYLSVVQDVTERLRAYELLEERVEDRTRELSTLLEVSHNVSSTLELRPLLELILDQLMEVVEYTGATISLIDGDEFEVMVQRGPVVSIGLRLPLAAMDYLWEPLQHGPLIVDDVQGDSPTAIEYRRRLEPLPESARTSLAHVRSWMVVPLLVGERLVGHMHLDRADPGAFTAHHAELAMALAQQAAIAIENARLYEQATERTRELSALLEVSHNVSSTLELRPLLDLILDQIAGVVEYAGASISLIDGGESEIVAFRGRGSADVAVGLRTAVDRMDMGPLSWQTGPVIIDDVRADTPEAFAYRRNESELLDSSFSYVRSWMAVPLTVNERLVGVLTLNGDEPGLYTPHHAELVLGIASQAAIAIENARLYERSEQRTRELAALLDVSRDVTSTLELQPLLGLILDQLKLVAPYSGAAVFELQEDDLVVLVRRAPGPDPNAGPSRYPRAEAGWLWELFQDGTPFVIDDVRGDTALAHAYQRSVGQHLETTFAYERSVLCAPMLTRERVIGVLTLSSDEAGYFTPHHVHLALAIAQQAAIAIENARLYEQAQQLAALEERQRLARELHDSVSQALFGIGLGARTARAQLERDVAQAGQSIDYVLALTQSGMAEMRALIFELRPESLEKEGLVQALTKQADAVRARYEIEVTPSLCDEPDVPLAVKEALYRIGQEAVHNAVKHAQPRSVAVSLEQMEGELVLKIRDDGHGFDPGGSFPGHLGLHSMQERAQRVGGALEVESRIGEGTLVRVRVPSGHG